MWTIRPLLLKPLSLAICGRLTICWSLRWIVGSHVRGFNTVGRSLCVFLLLRLCLCLVSLAIATNRQRHPIDTPWHTRSGYGVLRATVAPVSSPVLVLQTTCTTSTKQRWRCTIDPSSGRWIWCPRSNRPGAAVVAVAWFQPLRHPHHPRHVSSIVNAEALLLEAGEDRDSFSADIARLGTLHRRGSVNRSPTPLPRPIRRARSTLSVTTDGWRFSRSRLSPAKRLWSRYKDHSADRAKDADSPLPHHIATSSAA